MEIKGDVILMLDISSKQAIELIKDIHKISNNTEFSYWDWIVPGIITIVSLIASGIIAVYVANYQIKKQFIKEDKDNKTFTNLALLAIKNELTSNYELVDKVINEFDCGANMIGSGHIGDLSEDDWNRFKKVVLIDKDNVFLDSIMQLYNKISIHNNYFLYDKEKLTNFHNELLKVINLIEEKMRVS